MAYRSYLLDKFDYTHENKFFRRLDEKFRESFKDEVDDCILIGNLNVSGNSLDALFIKRGLILVIDFKDYSGELTFSENGPWKLNTIDGKTIFVAGGAHSRNPYQQVNTYRYALFHFLSQKQHEILDVNHQNANWSHTNGLVLFQRKVTFNLNSIPPKIQRYFHISHDDIIASEIKEIHSQSLNFSNKELQNILNVLNVTDTFLYNREKTVDVVAVDSPVNPERMGEVVNLIPNLAEASEIKRALGFYKTMLSIERIADANVKNVIYCPINWSAIHKSNYILSLENNLEFLATWIRNIASNFPQNLFISVNLVFEQKTVPFFYSIIQHSDIKDDKNIAVNFDSFDIFRPTLRELNLPEDIIEELITKAIEKDSLMGKITAIQTYLDTSLELVNSISLGLSQESTFNLQLHSELNNWINGNLIIKENPVFDAFLTNKALSNNPIPISNQPLIQITSLNAAQKKGLSLCFKQPLTIITGPPGSGKSQVVANILANAVFRNEKVLFSSKNNKAVDNVHQRINELLNTNYFLRLGTAAHNLELINVLNQTVNEINNNSFEDKSNEI